MSSVNVFNTDRLSVLDTNKFALVAATKLEVGNMALEVVTEQLLKALPEPIKTILASTPASKILVANLINLLVQQANIKDEKLITINDAMMTVSYQEFLGSFDVLSILKNALSKVDESKLNTIINNV